ncbi:MAG: amino acid permease, partial [Mycoplasmataceae bacterium]|nr:amino acid permease [Mycoplasmataceae bacterium]
MLLRRSKQINTKKLSSSKTNKKDRKKIGFLSGVMFIISTVIGVGIFLKNGQILSLNLGNFTLSILAWIITSITVISLGLSLLVIAAKTNSDLGILQWAKDFLSPKIFETIKFYFLFIYIPLIVCGDAYYFLQSLQQAFPSWHLHWYITWIITFLVIMYFVIVNTLKPFMIMVHAYIAFYIKLIPIFFFAIIAFIFYFVNYDNVQETTKQLYALNDSGFIHPNQDDLNSYFYKNPMLIYGPEIGFFLSIPAMFFTYDGFYYVVSIKKQLKDPKQSPKIILIGMICLAVIFILITLSLLWSTSAYDENGGTILGVKYLHSTKVWRAINAVLNIAICIGCLGILSGSINFSSCLYKEILLCHDLPFAK